MSSNIRKSARGEACTIRLEGCYGGANNETVVFAHLSGGAMGAKCLDIHGAYSCHSCHDILDGRKPSKYSKEELLLTHLLGMKRTQEILVSKGLM
jgi:uncharacterized CHY-type Zn-finger protein